MLKEQLITLGFTFNEAEVYIRLNELGQNKAGELIKKTGFHRNIVYEALDRLVERKLVAKTIRQGVAYFRVLDPSRLLDEIKLKENVAAEVVKELSERHEAAEQEVEIYEGMEGIKTYRNKSLEVLQPGEEILIFGASKSSTKPLNDFWQKYHQRRAKKNIKSRIIWNADAREYGEQRQSTGLIESKYFPSNLVTPAFWEIWSNRVGIGILEEEPVLMSIKNQRVADSFRNYFDLLWHQKVKTFEGMADVKNLFYEMLGELHLGEEYLVLGASWGLGYFPEIYDFFDGYHRDRQKKGVRAKLLFTQFAKAKVAEYKNNYKLAQVRFLPQEISPSMQINIFHDKVLMFTWQENPISFYIDNKLMADSLRAYFNGFWAQAEEYKLNG